MTSICKDLNKLQKQTADKAKVLQTVARKYWLKIIPFETIRTKERQAELYSIGRTTQKNKKPVTRTMYSLHLSWKAVDRVFEWTMRQWDRDSFWAIAKLCWFDKIPQESCHTQCDERQILEVMQTNSKFWNSTNDYKIKSVLHDINSEFIKLWYAK